jgi:hypothetical protein
MGLNQDYSCVSSVYMRNDQEIGLRWHASRKCRAEIPKQYSLCAAWLHPACNSKPVARRRGTKVLHNMLKRRSLFTVSSKKIGPSSPWLEMATHTLILGAWCTFSWNTCWFSDAQNRTFCLLTIPFKCKCASPENQTLLEKHLIILIPFRKCQSLMSVLRSLLTFATVWERSVLRPSRLKCLWISSSLRKNVIAYGEVITAFMNAATKKNCAIDNYISDCGEIYHYCFYANSRS